MRRIRRPAQIAAPIALLALASALACTEAGPAPAGPDGAAPPGAGADFGNAPPASGPFLVRFESGFGLTFTDSDRRLVSLHVLDDGIIGCREATAESEPLTVQAVQNPGGPLQALARSGSTFTAVFDFTGLGEVPPLCELVASPRFVAEGFSRLTLADNDVTGSGSRAHRMSFLANGTLENRRAGGHVAYSLNAQLLARPGGALDVLRSDVALAPDPR